MKFIPAILVIMTKGILKQALTSIEISPKRILVNLEVLKSRTALKGAGINAASTQLVGGHQPSLSTHSQSHSPSPGRQQHTHPRVSGASYRQYIPVSTGSWSRTGHRAPKSVLPSQSSLVLLPSTNSSNEARAGPARFWSTWSQPS